MDRPARWSRILIIIGLVAMVIGALDPLEGSLIILPGITLVTLGAWLGKSRHRLLIYRSFVLVVIGEAALWGSSALGGFGPGTGISYWWTLTLLPYPIGWIMGLVGAIRTLREDSLRSAV